MDETQIYSPLGEVSKAYKSCLLIGNLKQAVNAEQPAGRGAQTPKP
jgi:hypothetical protein